MPEKLEFEAYKLRMEKHLRIFYLLFFTLLLVVVVLFLSRKLKKEKEKVRGTIEDLNREILQKDKESHNKMVSLLQELEDKDKILKLLSINFVMSFEVRRRIIISI